MGLNEYQWLVVISELAVFTILPLFLLSTLLVSMVVLFCRVCSVGVSAVCTGLTLCCSLLVV